MGGPESADFGGRLRAYRLAAGLSQEALADRAGLSRRGIADLERGARRSPYGETVRRLADALALDDVQRAELLAAAQHRQPGRASQRYALPVQTSELVGRTGELSELESLLEKNRLLTLSGPAGIGKTRLALELGHRVREQYEDGALLVELAPLTDSASVATAFAVAVGARETPGKTLSEMIVEQIGTARLLAIVDNCEHVLDSSAAVIALLLRNCPRLQIVSTSREPMRIEGETVWPAPSLQPDEAVQLFIERALSTQASRRFADADTILISEICQRLEGMPLAIELAAARVSVVGLRQIVDRLDERLALLSAGRRGDPPRHQTLRAAIDWSYGLLVQPERDLFNRLAVFAGGFDFDALQPVCAWPTLDTNATLDLLAALVDKSLVVAEVRAERMRYRLLETMRQYAAERLDASGQADEIRRRHIAYYRSLVQEYSSTRRGLNYAANMDLVKREHDNLRSAVGALLTSGDLEQGLELCNLLGGFWVSQGLMSEGEEWFTRFLAKSEHVRWQTLAQSLYTLGRIAEYRGDFEAAHGFHERTLGIARQNENVELTARALFGLASVDMHVGRYAIANERFGEGVSLARRADIPSDLSEALGSLGRIADLQGEYQRARAYRQEALEIQRHIGDRWGVAFALHDLSDQLRREGDLERAESMLEESHVLYRQAGSRMGERSSLMSLATIALERGALLRAANLARQSLELCQEMADASATTARCVEIASEVLLGFDETELVVRLIAAANAHRELLGAPVPPDERSGLDRTLDAARALLTPEGFRDVWQNGIRLGVNEAVELAANALETTLAATVR